VIDLKVGQKASKTKSFTQEEVLQFSSLSEDSNPIHFDSDYSANTIFKKPINQGFLSAGLIGGLFGSELPGQGTVYLSQTMKFYKPIYVGDEVTAEIEIIDIEPSKPIITFRTVCKNNKGEIAIDGEALVTLMK
jgi:acyl dehydratase